MSGPCGGVNGQRQAHRYLSQNPCAHRPSLHCARPPHSTPPRAPTSRPHVVMMSRSVRAPGARPRRTVLIVIYTIPRRPEPRRDKARRQRHAAPAASESRRCRWRVARAAGGTSRLGDRLRRRQAKGRRRSSEAGRGVFALRSPSPFCEESSPSQFAVRSSHSKAKAPRTTKVQSPKSQSPSSSM